MPSDQIRLPVYLEDGFNTALVLEPRTAMTARSPRYTVAARGVALESSHAPTRNRATCPTPAAPA